MEWRLVWWHHRGRWVSSSRTWPASRASRCCKPFTCVEGSTVWVPLYFFALWKSWKRAVKQKRPFVCLNATSLMALAGARGLTSIIAQSCCEFTLPWDNAIQRMFTSIVIPGTHLSFFLSLFALWFKALDVLACTLFQPTRYCGAAGSGADTSPFEPLFQRYVQNVSRPIQCFSATCPLWLPRAQSGNDPTVLTVLIQQAILNPKSYRPMGWNLFHSKL